MADCRAWQGAGWGRAGLISEAISSRYMFSLRQIYLVTEPLGRNGYLGVDLGNKHKLKAGLQTLKESLVLGVA